MSVRIHWAGSRRAIGDLNGDGTNDLLWHNPTTGNVDLWKLVNGQWAGSVDIGPHPLGYQVAGIADFDLDGTSDVLWYNPIELASDSKSLEDRSNGQLGRAQRFDDLGSHPLGLGAGSASATSITTAPATSPGTIPRRATSISGRS